MNKKIIIIFLILVAGMQIAATLSIMKPNLEMNAETIHSYTTGYPLLKVSQNRILTPTILQYMEHTGLTRVGAYKLFIVIGLIVFYSLLIYIGSKHSLQYMSLSVFISAFLLTFLFRGLWLNSWDILDLSIFLLFTWAVLEEKGSIILFILVLIELFNREVALIMAAWMALYFLNKRRLLPCIGASVIGIAGAGLVWLLRDRLTIEEIGPRIFVDLPKGYSPQAPMYLMDNIHYAWNMLHTTQCMSLIFVIALGVLTAINVVRYNKQVRDISVLYAIIWVATLMASIVSEGRVWSSFVPYLALTVPMMLEEKE